VSSLEETNSAEVEEEMPIENTFPGITLNISPRFVGLPDRILFLLILTIIAFIPVGNNIV
jgi:hypothetical protein